MFFFCQHTHLARRREGVGIEHGIPFSMMQQHWATVQTTQATPPSANQLLFVLIIKGEIVYTNFSWVKCVSRGRAFRTRILV